MAAFFLRIEIYTFQLSYSSIALFLPQLLLCGKVSYSLVSETLIGLWTGSPRKKFCLFSLIYFTLNWDVTVLTFLFIPSPEKKALIFTVSRLRHLYISKVPLNLENKECWIAENPFLCFCLVLSKALGFFFKNLLSGSVEFQIYRRLY